MKRIRALEKFRWNGWEFRLSHSTATEAHWQMRHGSIQIRLIYRDIKQEEAPPEYTAILRMHGLAESTTIGATAGEAIADAVSDFKSKLLSGFRLHRELLAGNKRPDDG